MNKFIEQTKTPFIKIKAFYNESGKKKYEGLVKDYTKFSYEYSLLRDKYLHFAPNQVLVRIPDNILVIDTDEEAVYSKLKDFLILHDLYDEQCITKSEKIVQKSFLL